MDSNAIDSLCRAILEQALTDGDYEFLTATALGQAICAELRVDASALVESYKRYYR